MYTINVLCERSNDSGPGVWTRRCNILWVGVAEGVPGLAFGLDREISKLPAFLGNDRKRAACGVFILGGP